MDASMDDIYIGAQEEDEGGDSCTDETASRGFHFALGSLTRDLLMDILNSDELSVDDVSPAREGVRINCHRQLGKYFVWR